MALFYPPPQPFVGGHQPLAPADLPPAVTAVPENPPPFSEPQRKAVYLAVSRTWDPPPPGPYLDRRQAYAPRLLAPALTAVPVNDPPFGVFAKVSPESFDILTRSWQPGPPRPWFGFPLNIKAAGLSVDNPPFGVFARVSPEASDSLVRSWQPGPPWVWYPPKKQIVSVDNPPTLSGLSDFRDFSCVLTSWIPGPPLPATLQKTIVSVDNPPGYSVGPLANLVAAWRPGPPQPWPGYKLNPVFEAVLVDNPPVTSGQRDPRDLLITRQAWEPGPPNVYRLPQQVVDGGAVVFIQPPYSQAAIYAAVDRAWRQDVPYAYPGAKQIISVDNPPFAAPRALVDAWWAPQVQSWVLRPVPQGFVAGQVPYRAADMLAALRASWEAAPVAQQFYQRRIESVDNPPFPGPSQIAEWWRAKPVAEPWPGYRLYTPGYVPDNPPFASGLRRQVQLWPVIYAWLPPAPLPWVGPKAAGLVRITGYLVAEVRFLPAVDAESRARAALIAEFGLTAALGGEKETKH